MNYLPQNWKYIVLSDIADINPRPLKNYSDDLEVSFIPMKAVEEENGIADSSNTRRYSEVKKGFTSFTNGDILFAKITPCMENGKIAVVTDLVNGIGFGSTEFHVLRPSAKEVRSKYLFYFLVNPKFRKEAQGHMTGAVGQQRVPKDYLQNIKIPLPPLSEQDEIIKKLDELFDQLRNIKDKLKNLNLIKEKILESVLFNNLANGETKLAEYIEECSTRVGEEGKFKRKVGVSSEEGVTDLRYGKTDNFCKYKLVNKMNFVYNPMRINVGSIALYEGDEAVITSPDYVVFKIKQVITPMFLLDFMKSKYGLREIANNTQGAVRERLYYENLKNINIPVLNEKEVIEIEKIFNIFHKMSVKRKILLENISIIQQSILDKAFKLAI